LQKLPVTFALDRAGFVGEDGETHQGLYDIALFRPVPDTVILAPASEAELVLMLDWSLNRKSLSVSESSQSLGPVMIRYPKRLCPPETEAFSLFLETGRGVFVRRNNAPICLAFTGSLYSEVLNAAERLASVEISADLYNLRFLKPIDEKYLADLMNKYTLMVFIEEGVREGGFGEYAAELALRCKCSCTILALGVEGNFAALGTRKELLQMNGLDGEGIAKRILTTENVWQTK
jgi:1-deoxy-D-xylulose-5-phosphate synthase